MNTVKQIVHANEVYKNGYTGKQIRIALLDTGVSMHADLAGKIVYFKDFVQGKKIPYDDNGHGTHIAGILCGSGETSRGQYAGMAPGAELIVLKVLDQHGNGNTQTALRALQWVKEYHKRYNIRLLNFSVGYLPNPKKYREQHQLLTAVDELWEQGVMIITAAGNHGPKNFTVTIPGISRRVVTVGACDDEKPEEQSLPYGYSGRGPTDCCIVKPEILAPGTNIISLSHSSDRYTKKSGTSMAAPVVCGAMALAFEKAPWLTPGLLKLQLYESVDRENEALTQNCWGILHVDKLLQML